MKRFIRMSLLTVMLLGSVAAFGAQFSIGIRIGPPPQPRVVRVMPRTPGPAYMWIEGYWYPVAGRYRWHDGYWTRAPYGGARWVVPHHDGAMYYDGYWEGDRGQMGHDHKSDRNRKDRDYRP
jgi:hypothetical protein